MTLIIIKLLVFNINSCDQTIWGAQADVITTIIREIILVSFTFVNPFIEEVIIIFLAMALIYENNTIIPLMKIITTTYIYQLILVKTYLINATLMVWIIIVEALAKGVLIKKNMMDTKLVIVIIINIFKK